MADIVLTIIGEDRPGLVDALASAVTDAGGSWTRSSMSRLGGKFAGIAVITIDEARVGDLDARLDPIRSAGLLHVVSSPLGEGENTPVAVATGGDERLLSLQLVGSDRPGIVSEIAGVLAAHDVGIVELESAVTDAPMSGELLFEASLVLNTPAALETDVLQSALESLANELMVDIELDRVDEL